MGCILACFRLGGNGRKKGNLVASSPGCSKRMEHLVSANQLASVFLCEEKDSPCLGETRQDNMNGDSEAEAKFLLACGAILESPAEFPEGHTRFNFEAEQEDSKLLESPPLLNASLQKPMQEEHANRTPPSLLSMNGEDGFSACKPGSCEPAEPQASCKEGDPLSLLMLEPLVTHLHTDVKAVESEDVKSHSVTECLRKSSSRDISTPEIYQQRELLDSKQSPYPTPLNLTDELQTPGTIYPTYNEKFATFRDGVRSEFIYPEAKPFVDTSQWKVCKDEPYQFSCHFDQQISTGGKYLLNQSSKEQEPPFPTGGTITSEPLCGSWIPGPDAPEAPIASEQPPKTPGCLAAVFPGLSQDRPIIGAAAAHRKEDEIPQVSCKQWNGNGVPNSTSKYKEDQKVSWHATPFEQRLEKAIVEENLFPRVALQELS